VNEYFHILKSKQDHWTGYKTHSPEIIYFMPAQEIIKGVVVDVDSCMKQTCIVWPSYFYWLRQQTKIVLLQ